MLQGMQHKGHLTNEHLMKRFPNQFNLALFSIRKAMEIIKSGAVDREDIINVAADVLEELDQKGETKE